MQDGLVSAAKAAGLLGVAPNTIGRWFDAGKFPNAFRVENSIRIPLSDIEAVKEQPFKKESA